ncbi:unnamed protein product [Nezara viridula]|uniref:Uncharacterized protein n=1 Tax=Nezara viridula TaxID=85310 RepID=A0A9P0HCR7_NEZVI|nr:unnamed protein product [Nezara viridula]
MKIRGESVFKIFFFKLEKKYKKYFMTHWEINLFKVKMKKDEFEMKSAILQVKQVQNILKRNMNVMPVESYIHTHLGCTNIKGLIASKNHNLNVLIVPIDQGEKVI